MKMYKCSYNDKSIAKNIIGNYFNNRYSHFSCKNIPQFMALFKLQVDYIFLIVHFHFICSIFTV